MQVLLGISQFEFGKLKLNDPIDGEKKIPHYIAKVANIDAQLAYIVEKLLKHNPKERSGLNDLDIQAKLKSQGNKLN